MIMIYIHKKGNRAGDVINKESLKYPLQSLTSSKNLADLNIQNKNIMTLNIIRRKLDTKVVKIRKVIQKDFSNS